MCVCCEGERRDQVGREKKLSHGPGASDRLIGSFASTRQIEKTTCMSLVRWQERGERQKECLHVS